MRQAIVMLDRPTRLWLSHVPTHAQPAQANGQQLSPERRRRYRTNIICRELTSATFQSHASAIRVFTSTLAHQPTLANAVESCTIHKKPAHGHPCITVNQRKHSIILPTNNQAPPTQPLHQNAADMPLQAQPRIRQTELMPARDWTAKELGAMDVFGGRMPTGIEQFDNLAEQLQWYGDVIATGQAFKYRTGSLPLPGEQRNIAKATPPSPRTA